MVTNLRHTKYSPIPPGKVSQSQKSDLGRCPDQGERVFIQTRGSVGDATPYSQPESLGLMWARLCLSGFYHLGCLSLVLWWSFPLSFFTHPQVRITSVRFCFYFSFASCNCLHTQACCMKLIPKPSSFFSSYFLRQLNSALDWDSGYNICCGF